jgi:hypothetical protein
VTPEQFKKFLEVMEGKAGASSGRSRATGGAAVNAEKPEQVEAEINRQTEAYEKQTEVIEKLEKQYSSLSQGITKKYELEEAKAIRDHSVALKQLALDLKNGRKTQEEYNTAVANSTEKMEAAREAAAGQKGMSDALTRVMTSATGLTLKSGSLTEKMVNLGNQLNKGASQGGSMKTAMVDMGKSMGKAGILKVFELLGAAFAAFAKLTTEFIFGQDKAISAFRKATGAGKEYNLQIAAISPTLRQSGVDVGEYGQAFTELYTSFSGFTELSKNEQTTIAETTSLLAEMGVSTADSAKIMDQMTRSLGMSAPAAKNVLLDLAGTAESIGVPMGKMARDFQGAFSELSKYGKGATGVFKDLAIQSKKTGIEVNRLMSITKQYDTFEGAATAVGKLNAILGGPYLNSIDMLNATESERIENIRKTLDLSGQQFEAMNRFEKMAIADALGMSVDEASRIFEMSSTEMQLHALEQEELADKAKSMQEMSDQIKNAFSALAMDMRPIVEDILIPMIESFSTFVSGWGKASTGASAFGTTMKYVSTIMAGMLIPLAGLIAVASGGTLIPISLALLGAAGVSLGIGFGAGKFVENKMDDAAGRQAARGDTDTDSEDLSGYASGGTVRGSASAWRARSSTPGIPINMNELGKEGAIVPDGTYIATASDMKNSIQASQLVVAELKGLRADLASRKDEPAKLVMADGAEFAMWVLNNVGLTPFG